MSMLGLENLSSKFHFTFMSETECNLKFWLHFRRAMSFWKIEEFAVWILLGYIRFCYSSSQNGNKTKNFM